MFVRPRALIITGFGINSDYELAEAFNRTGSKAARIHINDLITHKKNIRDFQIIAFPGGFSFGDHLGSGKIFANKFTGKLFADLQNHLADKKLVIGICNGFQVLVKAGILPNLAGGFSPEATLTHNLSKKFEDRWVYLAVNAKNSSPWTENIGNIMLPVRHGEGRLYFKKENLLKQLCAEKLDALYYADQNYLPTGEYPYNPNGSACNIAGLTDASGCVFGLMPHPEAFLIPENHPYWTLLKTSGKKITIKTGLCFFKNAARYFR
ncbi:MAG: hypothetical protein A2096_07420 [Spirochaetes bacterium GWF1_41_5]|nr:MAG: hypothetical protein A2096_07420 [Spirochaetes bacterium GWF1_41_5]